MDLNWYTQGWRALFFLLAVVCFVLAAVLDRRPDPGRLAQHRGRLVPIGLALFSGVFMLDAVDAA